MPRVDAEFAAMGTHCHVLIDADGGLDELADLARRRVELLEQCWSRFRPGSELSRLNARAGSGPVEVSADLLLLVRRMRAAWSATQGLFDPTVLASMTALGYDADFAEVAARGPAAWQDVALVTAPGMSAVRIDEPERRVALPCGVGLDPGAIGKGLAADVVAAELAAAGVRGALVNLGGDLAVVGRTDEPWSIDVVDERLPRDASDRRLRTITLESGTHRAGVATSTTLKRRWAQGRRHHVVDPRTGQPCAGDVAQATVVAASAADAEVAATAALLLPSPAAIAWLRERGVDGTVLTATTELTTGRTTTELRTDELMEVGHG